MANSTYDQSATRPVDPIEKGMLGVRRFLIILLAGLSLPIVGVSASSLPEAELQISFGETSFTENEPQGKTGKTFSDELGSYTVLTPLIRSMTLIRKTKAKGTEGFEDWVKEDAKYVAGYFGIAYAAHRFSNAFVSIDTEEFDRRTAEAMKPNPKKVLYINMVDDKDALGGYAQLDFQRRYGMDPQNQFLQVSDTKDLVEKLKALPQDSSIERIEIMGHGNPGKLKVGKEAVTIENLAALKSSNLKISAPGADVRLISCALAGGKPLDREVGERFVAEFGRSILPEGGSVYAATRFILAEKIPVARVMQHVAGISVMSDIFMRAPMALNLNILQSRHAYVRMDISKSSDCANGFSTLVRRVR